MAVSDDTVAWVVGLSLEPAYLESGEVRAWLPVSQKNEWLVKSDKGSPT